jgi:hypothetical protein
LTLRDENLRLTLVLFNQSQDNVYIHNPKIWTKYYTQGRPIETGLITSKKKGKKQQNTIRKENPNNIGKKPITCKRKPTSVGGIRGSLRWGREGRPNSGQRAAKQAQRRLVELQKHKNKKTNINLKENVKGTT